MGIWLAARGRGGAAGTVLILACLATALWGAAYAAAVLWGGWAAELLSPAETLRTAAWIIFLVTLLTRSWALNEQLSSSFVLAVVLGFTVALQLGADFADELGLRDPEAPPSAGLALLFLFTRLTVAIGGLVLVHNLYVNTAPSSRWGVTLLCIGLAALFGYDLNLYTLQLLTGRLSLDLFNIRGLVNTLIVPLIALSAHRAQLWQQLKVSRQVVFQTLSLAGIGGYLVLMSLAGYGLKLVGGDWGRLLQISFIFATIVVAAVVLLSGRFRAWARVQINKHFFAYKYDYRQEWLRFINTLSRTEAMYGSLKERVIQAVGEMVDSPGGALFTPDEDGNFTLDARWNYRGAEGQVGARHPLLRYLDERGRIVNLDEWRAGEGDYGGFALPEWAESRAAWLVVPLIHLERLGGFILLMRSLAHRDLNWEDYDLLRTAGRQTASYIAEHSTQLALSDALKFDEFNRRFAFIMHDIKNLVSQLSLLARNAERHANNPDFRADMVATLQGSVARMNDLLARLGQQGSGRAEQAGEVELVSLLEGVVAQKRAQHAAIALRAPPPPVRVGGDEAQLEQAFAHLVQNAIDASEPGAPVTVALVREGAQARVDVIDEGCGMSAAFMREELFKPFHSTKEGGFGIGAFEAREIVRGAGGKLSVASRVDEGTVFTIALPLRSPAPARAVA